MSIYKKFVPGAFTIAALLSASLAYADPKPSGAKPSSNQTVANFYAGTTRLWKSCKGGVYFGAKFQAQAYCNKSGPSVGLGKWSVKNGVVCTDLVWYWKQGDGVGSKPADKKNCIAHVTDAEGQMWRRWNNDADWWRVKAIKDDKSASKGFKFKSKVNKLRRKLDV